MRTLALEGEKVVIWALRSIRHTHRLPARNHDVPASRCPLRGYERYSRSTVVPCESFDPCDLSRRGERAAGVFPFDPVEPRSPLGELCTPRSPPSPVQSCCWCRTYHRLTRGQHLNFDPRRL